MSNVIREDVVQITFKVQDDSLQDLVETVKKMKALITDLTKNNTDEFQNMLNVIKETAEGIDDLAETAKKVSNTNVDGLKNSVNETSREAQKMNVSLTSLIRQAVVFSKIKLAAAFQGLKAIPRTVFNKITGGLQKMKNGFSAIKNISLKKLLSDLNQIAGNGITKAWQGAKKLGVSLKETFQNKFSRKGQQNIEQPKEPKMKGFGQGVLTSVNMLASGMKATTQLISQGVKEVYQFGSAYETSLKKTSTLLDQDKLSIKELNTQVMDLSNRTGEDAAGLQESVYQALSAGADASKVTSLVETATKAAKGGATDTSTAIAGLTSTLNAFEMETEQADSIANSFFIAQKMGKATFGELTSGMSDVAPTAKSAGVGVNELLASVTTLTADGMGTSEAMSGMESTLANIVKPSEEAAKTAKRLGIDFSASAIKSKGFSGFLEDIKEKTGGNTETMEQLFGSVDALNTVMALTSAKGSKQMADTLNEMSTNTTALDDAYNTMTDTAEVSVQKGLNSFKNLGIGIYQSNEGIISDLTGLFADSAQELYTAFEQNGLEGLSSQIGTTLSNILTKIISYFPQLIQSGALIIQSLISGIMQNKDQLVQSVLLGIGYLVTGIVEILPQLLDLGIELIYSLGQGIIQSLPQIAETGFNIILTLLSGVGKALPMLGKLIWDAICALVDLILHTDWLDVGKKLISSIADGFIGGIKSLFGGGKEAVKEAQTEMSKEISNTKIEVPYTSIVDITKSQTEGQQYAQSFLKGVSSTEITSPKIDWTKLVQDGNQGGEYLSKGIQNGVSKNKIDLSKMTVGENIELPEVKTTGLINNMNQVAAASNQMQSNVSNSIQTVNASVNDLSAMNGLEQLPQAAAVNMSAMNTEISKGMNIMKKTIKESLSGIVTMFRSEMKSIKSIVSSTSLYSSGQNVVNGLIKGINSQKARLIETAKLMGKAVKEAFDEALDIHSPSREMKKTGVNVVLGTKIGMEDTFGELQKTSQKMGYALKEEADKKVDSKKHYRPSNISSINKNSSSNNFVYNPTFDININGSVDKQSEFKLRRLIKEVLKEDKEQVKRLYPRLREV